MWAKREILYRDSEEAPDPVKQITDAIPESSTPLKPASACIKPSDLPNVDAPLPLEQESFTDIETSKDVPEIPKESTRTCGDTKPD